MTSCLFLSLPTSLSGFILSDWVTLKSLGRLDSAVCSKSLRPILLELFACKECNNKSPCQFPGRIGQWIADKNIGLSHLQLKGNLFAPFVPNYLLANGRYVESVSMAEFGMEDVSVIEEHCHNLRKFECLALVSSVDCVGLIKKNPKLQELQLIGPISGTCNDVCLPQLECLTLRSNQFDNACALAIVHTVKCLLKLNLSSSPVTCSGMLAIAEQCPHLKCLELPKLSFSEQDTAFFVQLTISCPLVVNLGVCTCSTLTDQHVLDLAQGWKHLRAVNLPCSNLLTNECLQHLATHSVKSLKKLYIGHFGFSAGSSAMTDASTFGSEAVSRFLGKCPLCEFEWPAMLISSHHRMVSVICADLLAAGNITSLSFMYINDEILRCVGVNCHELQVLHLRDCNCVEECTHDALCAMAQGCTKLVHITVPSTLLAEFTAWLAPCSRIRASNESVKIFHTFDLN